MKIAKQREKERSAQRNRDDSSDEWKKPELPRKDIVAVIIAMFQLFLPLIVGLVIVGVIVALILR
ncbi:hypothetical protein ACFLSW_01210 [Candidatus Bipolaricaulota bacterium]